VNVSSDPNLPVTCPLSGKCRLTEKVVRLRRREKPYAFVALPYQEAFNDTESTIKIVLTGGSLFERRFRAKKLSDRVVKAVVARDQYFVGNGFCKVCQLSWFADFGIAELGTLNPCVMTEIGLMWGFGKRVIFTLNRAHTQLKEVPFDLTNFMVVPYQSLVPLAIGLDGKVKFLLLTELPRSKLR
jgi:hypothetical protein